MRIDGSGLALPNRGMAIHLYVSHPQVLIDPAVPVPQWGLSDLGRQRTQALAKQPWIKRFGRVVCSAETKAVETAVILADALGVTVDTHEAMHENDRSATGFLPPPEFEAVADLFFRHPTESIRGWERAVDAQSRIVTAVTTALSERSDVPTIFVGHGGVGTLLLCHVAKRPISRTSDQPPGGGNHYCFDMENRIVLYGWRALEAAPEPPP
jgi:broad specificity phosphatase PhoE